MEQGLFVRLSLRGPMLTELIVLFVLYLQQMQKYIYHCREGYFIENLTDFCFEANSTSPLQKNEIIGVCYGSGDGALTPSDAFF